MITEYLPYAACLCGGAIFGFLTCAVLTAGKVAENDEDWHDFAAEHADRAFEAEKAHTRVTDALAAKNDRIDRALECVTENSAHVGKKMAAILKGER